MKLIIKEFFNKATWTLTYVVSDKNTFDAIIIDPVWDYDPGASKLSTTSVDEILSYVNDNKLNVHYILETHAHADHISGAQVLKQKIPNAKIGIGAKITDVQKVFKTFFNLNSDFNTNGNQFDILLTEDDILKAGSIEIKTLFTPGHTPACSSFIIEDCAFVGDAIFMPDSGTGRCDFPAGSADDLYVSVHKKLYALPDSTRVFVGHDYMPNDRELQFESTIGEQKEKNIQLKAHTTREEFVVFRTTRDKTLEAPKLILPSVQINIAAGLLPVAESNGEQYLKIPIR